MGYIYAMGPSNYLVVLGHPTLRRTSTLFSITIHTLPRNKIISVWTRQKFTIIKWDHHTTGVVQTASSACD